MIKKIKRAAEFLGYDISEGIPNNYKLPLFTYPANKVTFEHEPFEWVEFNPHEKDGRHWLVEMEDKLDEVQSEFYIIKLCESIGIPVHMDYVLKNNDIYQIKKAPSKLCFKIIMEIIN